MKIILCLYEAFISHIVARPKWSLACARWRSLGMLEELLRHYLGYGDSVLLANLIDITLLLTFRSHPANWKFHTLPSKCDVLSTLPSLQYDFCTLWNEIALEAQNGKDPIPTLILENIRPVYIALHTGTDGSPKAFFATATYSGSVVVISVVQHRRSSFLSDS